MPSEGGILNVGLGLGVSVGKGVERVTTDSVDVCLSMSEILFPSPDDVTEESSGILAHPEVKITNIKNARSKKTPNGLFMSLTLVSYIFNY